MGVYGSMNVYVVTCENFKTGEKYVECVFAKEEDAITFINKHTTILYTDWIYDYCVFEVKEGVD